MTTLAKVPPFKSSELNATVEEPKYINGDDHAEKKCLSDDRVMGLAFDSLYGLYAEDEANAHALNSRG